MTTPIPPAGQDVTLASVPEHPPAKGRRSPLKTIAIMVLILVLAVGPPSGVAYYLLFYQARSADDTGSVARILDVQMSMDPADPVLFAVELEVSEQNPVRRVVVLGDAGAGPEAALAYFNDDDRPMSVSFSTDGRPEFIVTPEDDRFYLEYRADDILLHFLLEDGRFGVHPVPIDASMRQILDATQADLPELNARLQPVPGPDNFLPAMLGATSLLAENPVNPGSQTDLSGEISFDGWGLIHVFVQNEEGRPVPSARLTVSGCQDCIDVLQQQSTGQTEGFRFVLEYRPYTVAVDPPANLSDRSVYDECNQLRLRREPTWSRTWMLINLTAGVIATYATAGTAAPKWVPYVAGAATTLATGLPASETSFPVEDCDEAARYVAQTQWTIENKPEIYDQARQDADAYRSSFSVCVSHPWMEFSEPCVAMDLSPYSSVDLSRRVGSHTFVGTEISSDPWGSNFEVCSPLNPTGQVGPLPVSVTTSTVRQRTGVRASIFAPPGHESRCTGSDNWVERETATLLDRLQSGGMSENNAGRIADMYRGCFVWNVEQGLDNSTSTTNCHVVVASGSLAPADPSQTWQDIFPGAAVENEIFVMWFSATGVLWGRVEVVFDIPGERIAERVSESDPAYVPPDQVAGCQLVYYAWHTLAGDYASASDTLAGTVTTSIPPVLIQGTCQHRNILEAERDAFLAGLSLAVDGTELGSAWSGMRRGDVVSLQFPFLGGVAGVDLAIILD